MVMDPTDVETWNYEPQPGEFKFLFSENDIEKNLLSEDIILELEEGSIKNFIADFGSVPFGAIVMTLRPENEDITILPDEIQIDLRSYKIPVPFQIIFNDDSIAQGNRSVSINIELMSLDGSSNLDPFYEKFYTGLGDAPPIALGIIDNDTANVFYKVKDTETELSDSINIIEGADIISYDIRLNTQPKENVYVNISLIEALDNLSITSGLESSIGSSGFVMITFTPEQWNKKTISLNLMDNEISTGDMNASAKHIFTSEDDDYNGIIHIYDLNLIDNDIAEVNRPANLMITEGENINLDISLSKGPISEVVIQLTDNSNGELILSSSEITFATDNWDTPKNIGISSLDNIEYTGDRTFNINYAVIADNANTYNGIDVIMTSIMIQEDNPDVPCEKLNADTLGHFPIG